MHRSEAYDLTSCVACGAELSSSVDRAYAIDDERTLCMACALARGGRFEEREDRWVAAPRLDDLPELTGQRT